MLANLPVTLPSSAGSSSDDDDEELSSDEVSDELDCEACDELLELPSCEHAISEKDIAEIRHRLKSTENNFFIKTHHSLDPYCAIFYYAAVRL